MSYNFRAAVPGDLPAIWEILQAAILRRKNDGSEQWQDGYPNREVIKKDMEKGAGFVLTDQDKIAGYAAIYVNDEPSYANLDGHWLTNDDFIVVHRLAIAEEYLGKGLAKKILAYTEDYAISKQIFSIRADTNFDNPAMMRIFENTGYVYCGEVFFRGKPRKAYEKVLTR